MTAHVTDKTGRTSPQEFRDALAQRLFEQTKILNSLTWEKLTNGERNDYRKQAAAALTALGFKYGTFTLEGTLYGRWESATEWERIEG